MAEDRQFAFGLFVFDPRTGRLWRDGSEVKLAPRAAAVLHLLAERAQELVTKQDLLERVWGGMAVGDDALTSCIQELRGVLGDDARHPHYIETRHRRGYRLMVPAALNEQSGAAAPLLVAPPEPSRLVGRVAELSELARAFDQARSSRRQIVFISGEPGIGKSALAEAFLEQLRTSQTVKMAHGQCLDHHGVGEPYLPLIEALTRLAGGPDGAAVKEILSAQAPSWLAQMPALWTRSERSALEARGRASRFSLPPFSPFSPPLPSPSPPSPPPFLLPPSLLPPSPSLPCSPLAPRALACRFLAHDARADTCNRGDRIERAAPTQARRHSLERYIYARLARAYGSPPGACPPHGDRDVTAG